MEVKEHEMLTYSGRTFVRKCSVKVRAHMNQLCDAYHHPLRPEMLIAAKDSS